MRNKYLWCYCEWARKSTMSIGWEIFGVISGQESTRHLPTMRNICCLFIYLFSGWRFWRVWGWRAGLGEREEGLCREISPRVLYPSAAMPAKAKDWKKTILKNEKNEAIKPTPHKSFRLLAPTNYLIFSFSLGPSLPHSSFVSSFVRSFFLFARKKCLRVRPNSSSHSLETLSLALHCGF